MHSNILVINAGSSSIKFSLFNAATGQNVLDTVIKGQIEGIGGRPRFVAKTGIGHVLTERFWDDPGLQSPVLLERLLEWIVDYLGDVRHLQAVGHRIVIGGIRYQQPVRITTEIMADLEQLTPLAPLHQPNNLAPVQAIAALQPTLPQIACFDTAFHRTIPPIAQLYGLPRKLTEQGIQGYGFHGLSYEYIAGELIHYDAHASKGRMVVAHLGSGASLCALVGGESIACTLGFSALDGLLMGTRPGRLDPGVLLYLLLEKRMNAKTIEQLLYRESGLLGVSGISNDMRDLLASDHPHAREAIDLFVYRAGQELGSMAAAAKGLDALVFTAGVGENAPFIRAKICEQAAWLGIKLDKTANRQSGLCISTPDSAVSVWVIPTNEELMIARHTASVMSASGRSQ